MWTLDKDKDIARALGRAIRHVRRVTNRPHIDQSREERLSQFVVSVRRELGLVRKADHLSDSEIHILTRCLAEKKIWYDVGEPRPNTITGTLDAGHIGSGYHGSHSSSGSSPIMHSDLIRWVRLSKQLENETDSVVYDIQTDLEEIGRGVGDIENSVDEVRRINQEADQIAGNLSKIFS